MTLNVKIQEKKSYFPKNLHAGSVWYGDKEFYWSVFIYDDNDCKFPGVRDVSLDTLDGNLDLSEGTFIEETGLPEEAYHEIMDALNEYVGGL